MADERAYFLLERFPRISDGIGSFFEWVELFPGVRLWWHQETYTDQELLDACLNDEHFFALRWIELRSRRMNFGHVCELEIIPDETRRFFDEEGLSELMEGEIDVHQLFSVFASFCLLLGGYNTQMRSCGSLNSSWRFLTRPENESSAQIEFESELTNHDWWGGENEIESIEVEDWESILPMIWMAGYTLFSDKSGRYSDLLEFYVIAMQTEDPLERNARFCRCLETIIRRSDGIAKHLRERIPFLLEISDEETCRKMGKSTDEAQDELQYYKSLINDAWGIRSKYWHGQSLNDIHYDKCMDCLAEFPKLLYWINRGLIVLSRVPSNEEFELAQDSGSLDWSLPQKWSPVEYETIEDWLYRIDGTYKPQSVERFKSLGGKEEMSYLEYLEKFGNNQHPTK